MEAVIFTLRMAGILALIFLQNHPLFITAKPVSGFYSERILFKVAVVWLLVKISDPTQSLKWRGGCFVNRKLQTEKDREYNSGP